MIEDGEKDSMLSESPYDQFSTPRDAFIAYSTQNADGSYTIDDDVRQEITDHFKKAGVLKEGVEWE